MDRMLYVAATGAAHLERAQAVHANNLANVSTDGYRSEFAVTMDRAIQGDGHQARNYGLSEAPGFDFAPGPIRQTDRNLDVAIEGRGMVTVALPDGSEGYTRGGGLSVDSAGRLLSPEGLPLVGGGGPIAIPPYTRLFIGADGGITVQPQGQGPETLIQIDQLKLVNPPASALSKSSPGVFVATDGQPLAADPEVSVASGGLESSNVNAVGELTEILNLSRQFELEVRMMKKAEESDEAASQLVRVG